MIFHCLRLVSEWQIYCERNETNKKNNKIQNQEICSRLLTKTHEYNQDRYIRKEGKPIWKEEI